MADWQDLRQALADQRVRLVGGVLSEKPRELRVGGKGGLDGDDDVGGEVCDAGDCIDTSVSIPCHCVQASIVLCRRGNCNLPYLPRQL